MRKAPRSSIILIVLLASLLTAGWLAPAVYTHAQSFTLSTAVGDIQVPLIHVSPGGTLTPPGTPVAPPFTAPRRAVANVITGSCSSASPTSTQARSELGLRVTPPASSTTSTPTSTAAATWPMKAST